MPEIPIPRPNKGPQETPLIRTSEPKTIIRNNKTTDSQQPIKGRVYTKEPTFKEKLRRSFVKEDLKSVRDYVVFDVLIPNVKKSVFDMFMGALGQTLGIQVPRSTISSFMNENSVRGASGYRNYTAIASRSRDPIRERNDLRYDRYQVRDLVFESKEEAMSLLEILTDICDQRHAVSVFDFYDKAGIRDGNHYTNQTWGWRNLNGVGLAPVETNEFESGIGYIIDLPDARPI